MEVNLLFTYFFLSYKHHISKESYIVINYTLKLIIKIVILDVLM